jgi:hypothetical protein
MAHLRCSSLFSARNFGPKRRPRILKSPCAAFHHRNLSREHFEIPARSALVNKMPEQAPRIAAVLILVDTNLMATAVSAGPAAHAARAKP